MVDGKPHSQSQGCVEHANGDVKDMLVAWLADNHSQDWITGIKFVHLQKNIAHHSGIKRSPYSALFGREARVGLTTSALPHEVLSTLESEEDLLAVIDQPSTSNCFQCTNICFQCSSVLCFLFQVLRHLFPVHHPPLFPVL